MAEQPQIKIVRTPVGRAIHSQTHRQTVIVNPGGRALNGQWQPSAKAAPSIRNPFSRIQS